MTRKNREALAKNYAFYICPLLFTVYLFWRNDAVVGAVAAALLAVFLTAIKVRSLR